MKITVSRQSGISIIHVTGNIDSLTSDEAQAFLDEEIKNKQIRIIVDLAQVDYMSSAGLRVLLTSLKSTRQSGGDLYLVELQSNVHQVLDLAGFTSIFKIFSTSAEALDAFVA